MSSTATYEITSIDSTSIWVKVVPDPAYAYYTIVVRLESDTTDKTHYKNYAAAEYFDGASSIQITGLTAGTDYVINVGYNNTGGLAVSDYIGAKEFTTPAEYSSVKIVYNANGGSGAPSSKTYTKNTSRIQVDISTTKPTRSGYSFLGWSQSKSATAPTYYSGNSYYFDGSSSGETYTLYAVWSKNATYYAKIIYNANGGSGAPSAQTVSGTSSQVSVKLKTTEPTRTGYEFQGWSTTQGATVATYQPGGTYTFEGATSTKEHTLYAVWEPAQYYVAVTYVPIDAVTDEVGERTYGGSESQVSVTMPTLAKEGYTFLGWSSDMSATSAEYSPGGSYNFTGGDGTFERYLLYAVWQKNESGGGEDPDPGGGSDPGNTDTPTPDPDPDVATDVYLVPHIFTGGRWVRIK